MGQNLRVFEGISDDQIKHLIKLTNEDSEVAKYTKDRERFKDINTFNKWGKGKHIYTLSNNDDDILGIAWFNKKDNPLTPTCKYTFAIRTYPPIRGKGYAKPFMKKAFILFGGGKAFGLKFTRTMR